MVASPELSWAVLLASLRFSGSVVICELDTSHLIVTSLVDKVIQLASDLLSDQIDKNEFKFFSTRTSLTCFRYAFLDEEKEGGKMTGRWNLLWPKM